MIRTCELHEEIIENLFALATPPDTGKRYRPFTSQDQITMARTISSILNNERVASRIGPAQMQTYFSRLNEITDRADSETYRG